MNINNDSNLITSGIIFNSLMISSSGATAAMGISESFYTTSWDNRWSFIAATAYCYSGSYSSGAYLSASYNMNNVPPYTIISATSSISDSKYVFVGTSINTTITLNNPYDGKYVVIRRIDTTNKIMTIQSSSGYFIIPIGNSVSNPGTIILATNSTGNLTTKLVCFGKIWYEI